MEDEHSIDEERYQTLGKVGRVLLVVYTEPNENKRRLITARVATSEERRIYYGTSTGHVDDWSDANA
jgi:uncharacterized DUF497 family protein